MKISRGKRRVLSRRAVTQNVISGSARVHFGDIYHPTIANTDHNHRQVTNPATWRVDTQPNLEKLYAALSRNELLLQEVLAGSKQPHSPISCTIETNKQAATYTGNRVLDFIFQLVLTILSTLVHRLSPIDPDSYLRRSAIYSEQYTLTNWFSNALYISSIETNQTGLQQIIHLNFAVSTRAWYLVRIEINVKSTIDDSQALLPASCSTLSSSHLRLPIAFENTLGKLLSILTLHNSRNLLRLSISEEKGGRISIAPTSIFLSQACGETIAEEATIIHLMKKFGCPIFTPSEICTKRYVFRMLFAVSSYNQDLLERKAPVCTSGSAPGEMQLQDFYEEIKNLSKLRECRGVVNIVGLVLDEQRAHIRSYLHENVYIHSLILLLSWSCDVGWPIEWSVRELWATQVVQAAAEVYRHGLIPSALHVASIALREDGSIVLLTIEHRRGMEKALMKAGSSASVDEDNSEMVWKHAERQIVLDLKDTFYRLASQATRETCLCGRFGCLRTNSTQVPGHASMSYFHPSLPQYFEEIIDRCSSSENGVSISVQELKVFCEAKFQGKPDRTTLTTVMQRFLAFEDQKQHLGTTVCDQCGSRICYQHYHCYVCKGGAFDLCLHCVTHGFHCDDSKHRLSKRQYEEGRVVDLGF